MVQPSEYNSKPGKSVVAIPLVVWGPEIPGLNYHIQLDLMGVSSTRIPVKNRRPATEVSKVVQDKSVVCNCLEIISDNFIS